MYHCDVPQTFLVPGAPCHPSKTPSHSFCNSFSSSDTSWYVFHSARVHLQFTFYDPLCRVGYSPRSSNSTLILIRFVSGTNTYNKFLSPCNYIYIHPYPKSRAILSNTSSLFPTVSQLTCNNTIFVMDIRIFHWGTTRFIIPVSLLPEGVTIGFFPTANNTPTLAQPTIPVTWQLLSEDNLSAMTSDELLTTLRQAYPEIPVPMLRQSWFNGAPFLGLPAHLWPSGTYHFPGTGNTPPVSVLPTASLVTTPLLTQSNNLALSPVTTSSHQQPPSTRASHYSTPSAAAGGPSMPSHSEPPPLASLSFSDFDLTPDNTGLFLMPSAPADTTENLAPEDSDRFVNRLLAAPPVLEPATRPNIMTSSAPVAAPQLSTTERREPSLFPLPSSSNRVVARPSQQVPPCVVTPRSHSGKRPSSSRSEGSHAKRSATSSIRHTVHRSPAASSAPSPHGASSTSTRADGHRDFIADPILSSSSSHRSSQHRVSSTRSTRPPASPTSATMISSESSGEEDTANHDKSPARR